MDKLKAQTSREFSSSAAKYGAVVWAVYAIIEWMFSSLLPWIIKPNCDYIPKHWGFTILLFIIYPVIGLIIGGLAGMGIQLVSKRIQFLQRVQTSILAPVIVIFTIILIFNINLAYQYLNNPMSAPGLPFYFLLLPLFISLLMILGLVLVVTYNTNSRWFAVCVNPWAVSFLLLGITGASREIVNSHSLKMKVGLIVIALIGYPVATLLATFLIRKIFGMRQVSGSTENVAVSPARPLIFLVPTILFIIGVSLFLKQDTIHSIQDSKSLSRNVENPNVILIVMDTVRADHMSVYGYRRDTTPNLKKLSDESTLFTRAIAASDMTLSTHASIFTGMYARQHGAHYDPPEHTGGRPLSDNLHTIAEILSEKGYSTMGVVSNHGYLSYKFNMNQGFHYYDQRLPVPFLGIGGIQKHYIIGGVRDILTLFSPPFIFDQWFRNAEEINSKAFTLLDKVKKDNTPFFLFVNYMDAHEPYIPPAPYDTLYSGKLKRFTTARYYSLEREVMHFKQQITDKERNHVLSQYDGGIAYIDFNISKLITKLKEDGLYKNTIIIITSDHGEAFGEKNLLGHGVSVYQDQVYVPLIIKYPNANKKCVVNELVSSVDIMPTILDLVGNTLSKELYGQSLLKFESVESRSVISESFPNAKLTKHYTRFDRVERAIFSDSHKLITSTAGKKEIYDLSVDPNEESNLYNSTEDRVSSNLAGMLDQYLKDVVPSTSTSPGVDNKTLEHLKALGYVQ